MGQVKQRISYMGQLYRWDGNYYIPVRGRGKSNPSLHRKVWIDHNGPIAKDHVIHHIDGDTTNNHIENLKEMTVSAHFSHHGTEVTEKRLKHLDNMRKNALEWHKTEYGIATHIESGKKSWKNRKSFKVNCIICGREYETYFRNKSKYCHERCKTAAHRARKSGTEPTIPHYGE